MTSCAPSADTTTAQPPDYPTLLANLIKESNPTIRGLNVIVDNSDPTSPKLTITGITNAFEGSPFTATITIRQDKGITTDPTNFIVTAESLISPYSTNTALTVTFEGEDPVSYTVTTQISGAAVSDWIVTEKLSEYITVSFGGQTPTLSITDTTLSITGLINIPGAEAGMLTLGNLPAGFTVEPSSITLPNPAGTDRATSTPNSNSFTITENGNANNAQTYTIASIDLARLARFLPRFHIKVTEGSDSTDIAGSLMITEEANNIVRIVGLTNKLGVNQYTLTIEQVPEFFTISSGTAITRTITEPTEEFLRGPGTITGDTGPTFDLINSGENAATTYTLVVDFFRATSQLSITSTDINGGTQTNVDSGTIIPITTEACQLLAAPTVSVVGVDGSRVASTTPFPLYYDDRGRDTSNNNKFTVTRSLTLEASDGTELFTGFMITIEFPACATFAGGTGADAASAYEIDNAPRLELLSHLVNTDNANYGDKYYKVTTDIDMGLPYLPFSEAGSGTTGKGFLPIGREDTNFKGRLDCSNNTISGLYINRPTEDRIGLVGSASNAMITNCALTDVNIMGQSNVGGLVGYAFYGRTTGSYTTGTVSGTSFNIGGLVGHGSNNTITNSYAAVNVSGVGVNAGSVGGLIGFFDEGLIKDSYAAGTVSGDNRVGGLGGDGSGASRFTQITNSYAVGAVSATNTQVGGFLGRNPNVTIINSYWDTETSGQSSSPGGTGRTTTQMQKGTPPQSGIDAVYVGWNTSNWDFTDGQYPRLKNVVCANRQYNQDATDCTSTLQ